MNPRERIFYTERYKIKNKKSDDFEITSLTWIVPDFNCLMILLKNSVNDEKYPRIDIYEIIKNKKVPIGILASNTNILP